MLTGVEGLGESSFAVLASVVRRGPCSAYDVKVRLDLVAGDFWRVPHTQVYRECERLADAGLLEPDQEDTGRRRRLYRATKAGRAAARKWARIPTEDLMAIRDLGRLKILAAEFSTPEDVRALARQQVLAYQVRIDALAQLLGRSGQEDPQTVLCLELGRELHEAALAFWTRLEAEPGAMNFA
jgi:DNA-binding PadR family transcriptional regulator